MLNKTKLNKRNKKRKERVRNASGLFVSSVVHIRTLARVFRIDGADRFAVLLVAVALAVAPREAEGGLRARACGWVRLCGDEEMVKFDVNANNVVSKR
jgi:hypothetical protein